MSVIPSEPLLSCLPRLTQGLWLVPCERQWRSGSGCRCPDHHLLNGGRHARLEGVKPQGLLGVGRLPWTPGPRLRASLSP
jgi:hypothetical protein